MVPGGKTPKHVGLPTPHLPTPCLLQSPEIPHLHARSYLASSNLSKLSLTVSSIHGSSGLFLRKGDIDSDSTFSHLSEFRGGSLLSNLTSSIGPRKVIGFQFTQHFFLVVKTRVTTSKLFTCQSWNQNFNFLLF